MIQVLLKVLQLILLGALECAHALEHLVPVDQGTVELRTVDADKLRLAANGQSASSAHARTVDHNRVQAYLARNIVFLSREVGELHHDGRTDGKHLVNMLLLDKLLDTYGDHTFLAIRAVIGHDDHLVARLAHLVFQYDQVFRTASHDREHTVASCLQRLDDGQHRCNAQTSAGTNHGSEILNMSGIAQRTHDVGHVVAFVQHAELLRRETHLLDNESDGSFLNIGTGNGQRHALAFLVDAHNDKITGLAALGNQRSLDLEKENLLRKLFFPYNSIHISLC